MLKLVQVNFGFTRQSVNHWSKNYRKELPITGYCGMLRLLSPGKLTDSSLYLPKPQQPVRQLKPFANDNEANAHKS